MGDWSNQTWWLYDLTVVAILVLCVWGGWRRGILRTIVGFMGYALAGLLSGILAQPIAEAVYDKWLASYCMDFIDEQLETYDLSQTIQDLFSNYGIALNSSELQTLAESDDATSELCAAVGISEDALNQNLLTSLNSATVTAYTGLPEWMTQMLLPTDSDTQNESTDRLIQTAAIVLSGDSESAAEALTQAYVRPTAISFLKYFIFFILFLLISSLLQVIIKGLSHLFRWGAFGQLNRILGMGLGCFETVLFLVLIKTLTQWIVESGSNQFAFFNETAIQKTLIFQWIYYL